MPNIFIIWSYFCGVLSYNKLFYLSSNGLAYYDGTKLECFTNINIF